MNSNERVYGAISSAKGFRLLGSDGMGYFSDSSPLILWKRTSKSNGRARCAIFSPRSTQATLAVWPVNGILMQRHNEGKPREILSTPAGANVRNNFRTVTPFHSAPNQFGYKEKDSLHEFRR
ncbi:hypothetical protein RSAG8_09233, partial [Rhizoctonia solani AG-8 WAC10335]